MRFTRQVGALAMPGRRVLPPNVSLPDGAGTSEAPGVLDLRWSPFDRRGGRGRRGQVSVFGGLFGLAGPATGGV